MLWLETEHGERGLGKNTDGLESLGACVGGCPCDVNTAPFQRSNTQQKYAVCEPCAISAVSEQDTEVMNEGI